MTSNQHRDAIHEAATAAVAVDVIAERLGGDARLFKRWAANNKSYLDYRIGLKAAELAGSTGGDVVDTSTLAKGVRAAAAGGELRRDGSAKGMRAGSSTEVKSTSRPRVVRVPGNGLLDTHTGTTISQAAAARLGYSEGAK
jgi:hypothetical protein